MRKVISQTNSGIKEPAINANKVLAQAEYFLKQKNFEKYYHLLDIAYSAPELLKTNSKDPVRYFKHFADLCKYYIATGKHKQTSNLDNMIKFNEQMLVFEMIQHDTLAEQKDAFNKRLSALQELLIVKYGSRRTADQILKHHINFLSFRERMSQYQNNDEYLELMHELIYRLLASKQFHTAHQKYKALNNNLSQIFGSKNQTTDIPFLIKRTHNLEKLVSELTELSKTFASDDVWIFLQSAHLGLENLYRRLQQINKEFDITVLAEHYSNMGDLSRFLGETANAQLYYFRGAKLYLDRSIKLPGAKILENSAYCDLELGKIKYAEKKLSLVKSIYHEHKMLEDIERIRKIQRNSLQLN